MAQVLKEEVRARIVEAAERTFAEKGYEEATIGEIARVAGISTGNVYRYYEDKRALFDDVVDAAFVDRFRTLLRRRVGALAGVGDARELAPDAAWFHASEDLMRFTLEHRAKLVIVLARARGTRWESLRPELVAELVALALDHFRGIAAARPADVAIRFALVRIYEALIEANARILAEHDDDSRIRDAVAAYSRYHLAGLRALFAT